ncbi:hypothetical protein DAI22_02g193350 [Oryza sativa Japonica Group]|nr:hypothetical protein DAI22_02g193350 [Oryza sativa Japonica Group]
MGWLALRHRAARPPPFRLRSSFYPLPSSSSPPYSFPFLSFPFSPLPPPPAARPSPPRRPLHPVPLPPALRRRLLRRTGGHARFPTYRGGPAGELLPPA